MPILTDYLTGSPIRPATLDEWARSKHAAEHEPGGTGAFDLDGRAVYVNGGDFFDICNPADIPADPE